MFVSCCFMLRVRLRIMHTHVKGTGKSVFLYVIPMFAYVNVDATYCHFVSCSFCWIFDFLLAADISNDKFACEKINETNITAIEVNNAQKMLMDLYNCCKVLFENKWDNQGFFRQSIVNECAHFRFLHCVVWSWIRLLMITFPIRLILSMYSETGYSLPIVLCRSFGFKLQWPKQPSGTMFFKIFRFWYGGASASHPFNSLVVWKSQFIRAQCWDGNSCIKLLCPELLDPILFGDWLKKLFGKMAAGN